MLSSRHLHHKNISKATVEALNNAHYLLLAAYIDEASQITTAMLSSGAWQVSEHTSFIDNVQRTHELLCWLQQKDCPAIADEAAKTYTKLQKEAENHWQDRLNDLLICNRLQIEPAGKNWSKAYFEQVKTLQDDGYGRYKDYGLFLDDLDWVTHCHLRQRIIQTESELTQYFSDGDINIAANALNYDIYELADMFADIDKDFRHKIREQSIGYMEINIYTRVMLMGFLDNNQDDIIKQFQRLLLAEDLFDDVVMLYYFPPFRDLAANGEFAEFIGIGADSVRSYLSQFQQRKATTPPITATTQTAENLKYANLATFKTLAKGTSLIGLPMLEVPIPQSDDTLLALNLKNKDLFSNWQAARQLLSQTNRYPVIVSDWQLRMHDLDAWAEFLDRDIYGSEDFEGHRSGISHHDIIEGAKQLDLDLNSLLPDNGYIIPEDEQEIIEYFECDFALDRETIIQLLQTIDLNQSDASLQLLQRAFALQVAKYGEPEPEMNIFEWFIASKDEPTFLLLLPTVNAWEVPAFINWYGAEMIGSEAVIAQLKQWYEKYQAEIVMSYGTLLNFVVGKPPATTEEAMELAYSHSLLAPCTIVLPGTPINEYAMGLMQTTKWCLHERP